MNKFWVACLLLIVSCLPGVASAESWLATVENNQDGTRTVQLKEGCEGVYELMKSSIIVGKGGLESPIFRGVAEQFVKDFNEPSQGKSGSWNTNGIQTHKQGSSSHFVG